MQVVTAEVEVQEPEKVFKFFRYVRPFDTHPSSFDKLAPHGGIAFYVELDPEQEEMTFSFTICREDEAFIKQYARDQTQAKFFAGEVYVIENYDKDSWVVDNIIFALHSYLGYSNLAFKPKNYPVILPSFQSVPSVKVSLKMPEGTLEEEVFDEDKQTQTLELLLGRLLRDNDVSAHIAKYREFTNKQKKLTEELKARSV